MKLAHQILIVILVLVVGCESSTNDKKSIMYPETKKIDNVKTYFGEDVSDPYQWLEDDLSSETEKWVDKQNDITFSYLKSIDYRDKMNDRLKELLNYERIGAPFIEGNFEYWSKNDGLQNHNVYYRKKVGSDDEEVFLDPNTFSEDGTVGLSGIYFSLDGSLSCHLITEGGSDWRKAIVMDTDSKKIVEDTIKNIKFSGIAWYKNEGFYYSSYEVPSGDSQLSSKTAYHKLYYHKIGTRQSSDELIFGGEMQPNRYIWGWVTEDQRFLVISSAQKTSGNQVYIKDLEKESPIIMVEDDYMSRVTYEYNEKDVFYFTTNIDAPNNRLVSFKFSDPGKENWKDVIPEKENVLNVSTAGKKFIANYMIDAKSEVFQYNLNGEFERSIELPGLGTAGGFNGKVTDEIIYFYFTSFTFPSTIYRYEISTGKTEKYSQPVVDFVPEDYSVKQVFYSSKDGTKIPMFIVHKKDLELNGKNPTYLYGYGGFNSSQTPSFNSALILWLENNGIYAVANLRGGGEYGEDWHLAGTKMKKQNVFDDFIAAGEYLISEKYTSSDFLAIAGGSNGGLLVGATMIQRPDLAKVALPAVGVMDMLKYHTFTSGAGWASDYGTAEDSKEMYEYLRNYSPYHALKEGTEYPATLVTTADHDDRVVPAHSFKFTARLQEYHRGNNPVLIRVQKNAGHGSVSLNQYIETTTDKFAFAWYNMGFVPKLAKKEY